MLYRLDSDNNIYILNASDIKNEETYDTARRISASMSDNGHSTLSSEHSIEFVERRRNERNNRRSDSSRLEETREQSSIERRSVDDSRKTHRELSAMEESDRKKWKVDTPIYLEMISIRERAIQNGTFLKINGKDSNLDEKSWLLVRTIVLRIVLETGRTILKIHLR